MAAMIVAVLLSARQGHHPHRVKAIIPIASSVDETGTTQLSWSF